MRDQPVQHFLNDLVVGELELNGACVIALRGNTAWNVRQRGIIKTSTTDRLLAFMLLLCLFVCVFVNLKMIMNSYSYIASLYLNTNQFNLMLQSYLKMYNYQVKIYTKCTHCKK